MNKYFCLNEISKVGVNCFADNYSATEDINEAKGILVRSAAMHDMEFSKDLLAIARAGAGVNNIPLERCTDNNIVVFNTPGANANSVKELVMAGLLLSARDVIGGVNWVKDNADNENIAKVTEKEKKNFAGNELQGKKLGIIGLGAIGVKVANCARSIGMEVFGYDPYISVTAAWNLSSDVTHVYQVEDIYKECDYITVHVPLMDATKKMINKDAIDKMKEGTVVLNFARDLLVDEEDMVKALDAGKIRKYVSDFPNTTVAGSKNCIVIPHLGASTEESEDNCAVMAVNEIQDYIDNGNIVNSVNFPECNLGKCQRAGRVAIFHDNVANMISQFTSFIGNLGINITDMVNKSSGKCGYTMIDLEQAISDDDFAKMSSIEGIRRIRKIK